MSFLKSMTQRVRDPKDTLSVSIDCREAEKVLDKSKALEQFYIQVS